MAIEIATYLPETLLTNKAMSSWGIPGHNGGTLSAEDIFTKTGVIQRYWAAESETVLQMAQKAARLLSYQWPDADFVFFTTSYPDGTDNAGKLSEYLRLKPSGYFNVHKACSGFTYVLAYIERNKAKFSDRSALIAASEKYSPTLPNLKEGQIDPGNSQTIFSDGAVVTRLRLDQDICLLSSLNHQFPKEGSQSIRMPINYSLVREPVLDLDEAYIPVSEDNYFRMDGRKVYEAVRQEVPTLILDAIEQANLNPENIALVIPHQASRHMLKVLEKQLPQLRFYHDLEDGNLSSASIPKAWGKAMAEGRIRSGDKLVLAGFGAGLFASIVVVELG